MTLNLMIEPSADAGLWWPLVIPPLFVALCTFVGGLAWAASVATSQRIRSFVNQAIVGIKLNWLEEAIRDSGAQKILAGASLHCLVIRFGTDDYFATLASQRERHEGRLINGVIDIGGNMTLTLPVHRKLGTQFKLYYLFRDEQDAGKLWQALRTAQARLASRRGHAVHQMVLDDDRPAGPRCWFRLAAYGAQTTHDKFATSYFAASQVPGFERRNKLKRWWWWMRTNPAQ